MASIPQGGPAVVQLNEMQAKILVNLIDVGSQRGAWRGADLTPVGQLHDHIVEGLRAAQKLATESAPAVKKEDEEVVKPVRV